MNIERRFGKHGNRDNHSEQNNKKISGKIIKHGGHGYKGNNDDYRNMVRLVTEVGQDW
jgi:hypothetical protein